LAKEDADERVAVDVVHVSLLQEHVCLVQQQDRAPCVADVQDFLQLSLQVPRIGAQLARRHHVQRTLEELRDALGGEGFARARRAVENSCALISEDLRPSPPETLLTNEALALPLDDVVDALGGVVLV